MTNTSDEQAKREHLALSTLRDAHGNMKLVLERINLLEGNLKKAIDRLDAVSQYVPKMYDYKGADKTLHERHLDIVNELRKALLPNG